MAVLFWYSRKFSALKKIADSVVWCHRKRFFLSIFHATIYTPLIFMKICEKLSRQNLKSGYYEHLIVTLSLPQIFFFKKNTNIRLKPVAYRKNLSTQNSSNLEATNTRVTKGFKTLDWTRKKNWVIWRQASHEFQYHRIHIQTAYYIQQKTYR
jgi:hypothetical protein